MNFREMIERAYLNGARTSQDLAFHEFAALAAQFCREFPADAAEMPLREDGEATLGEAFAKFYEVFADPTPSAVAYSTAHADLARVARNVASSNMNREMRKEIDRMLNVRRLIDGPADYELSAHIERGVDEEIERRHAARS